MEPLARRRALVALLLLGAFTACRHLPTRGTEERAGRQAEEAARAERASAAALPESTLSVLPFEALVPDSITTPLSHGLAALLLGDLAQVRSRLQVLERERLDAALREMKLAQSGVVDSASVPRVGRLVGARRLVVGILGTLPNGDLLLSVRIADVATGAVTGAVDASAPVARILEAEKALVFRVLEQLDITPTPAERAAIEQRPTENIGALLAYGRGVRDELAGNRAGARANYEQAIFLDGGFAAPRTRLAVMPLEDVAVEDGKPGRTKDAGTRRASLNRARNFALQGINPAIPSGIGGASDGAFPKATGTSVVIVVTTQP